MHLCRKDGNNDIFKFLHTENPKIPLIAGLCIIEFNISQQSFPQLFRGQSTPDKKILMYCYDLQRLFKDLISKKSSLGAGWRTALREPFKISSLQRPWYT